VLVLKNIKLKKNDQGTLQRAVDKATGKVIMIFLTSYSLIFFTLIFSERIHRILFCYMNQMFDCILFFIISVSLAGISIGSSYGTVKSSIGVFAICIMHPKIIQRGLMAVIMAGIYFLVAVVIVSSLILLRAYLLVVPLQTVNFSEAD
jgi:hypothetical protein